MLLKIALLCVVLQLHTQASKVPTLADSMQKSSPRNPKVALIAATPHTFTDHARFERPKRLERLSLELHPDIVRGKAAPQDLKHKIVIARKQNNLRLLETMVMDVSDPKSSKYGQHLTKDQVADITANDDAVRAIKEYLQSEGIVDVTTTRYNDYIIAEAPVHQWERILHAEFYEFEHTNVKDKKFVRSLQYEIPHILAEHVDAIFNTVQLPDKHFGKKLQFKKRSKGESTLTFGAVDPDLLNDFYNIDSNTGNSLTDQAVYAILDQKFSPSDLTTFQNAYGIPIEGISSDVGNHVDNDACVPDPNDCIEANLDVQYLMAVSRSIPTIYYYWTGTDVWLDWITTVADMADPPDLFTISYGSYEAAFDPAYLDAFQTEAIKLGLVGTTVLAASGDDGVAGFQVRTGDLPCGYWALFPASCPYVTAVGATMGPESNTDEVVCQSDGGSSITSGGGFSQYYTLPAWQAMEVAGYFDNVLGTSEAPVAGYNPAMRGYPDVGLMGNNYEVVADGNFYGVSGTSASCPVMAGMVALVNAGRRAQGNATLGWLNPAIYGLSAAFANDITSGDNKCMVSGAGCCSQGFYAAPGWDPITGVGSVDFTNFKNALLNINSDDYASFEPSAAPTLAPGYEDWVLYEGFSELSCPTDDGKLTTQSAFPTEECLVRYNSDSEAVGSTKYSCTHSGGFERSYSDTNCTTLVTNDAIDFDCRNFAAGAAIARSVSVRCAASEDLPLPVGVFVVERNFNELTCPLNRTASFNSWRSGYCFRSGSSSFKFSSDLVFTPYSGIDCDAVDEETANSLSAECSVNDLQALVDVGESTADVSTFYVLSDISDGGSEFSFLGLGYAAVVAIVVAIVCVILILLSFLCCAGCRGNNAHHATQVATREPIVCTVAHNTHPTAPIVVAVVSREPLEISAV